MRIPIGGIGGLGCCDSLASATRTELHRWRFCFVFFSFFASVRFLKISYSIIDGGLIHKVYPTESLFNSWISMIFPAVVAWLLRASSRLGLAELRFAVLPSQTFLKTRAFLYHEEIQLWFAGETT